MARKQAQGVRGLAYGLGMSLLPYFCARVAIARVKERLRLGSGS